MSQLDRIDPESRLPLEAMLAEYHGGICSLTDLSERRAIGARRTAEARAAVGPHPRVSAEDLVVPGADIPVRVFRPASAEPDAPGIFFIHSGGMIVGSIDGEAEQAELLADELGAVVVSVGYRLAPEHPHPAQSDDCFAAYTWMATHAGELGFDPARLAIYGGSAGGNLAIATALLARDRGGPAPVFVCAPYPMLDETNTSASSLAITAVGLWDRQPNIDAWAHFLGGREADAYASPLKADLAGLPPMFIDVGDVDLFRDEDLELVRKLLEAGVVVEFHLWPGAYHGSEWMAPDAPLSKRILAARLAALRRALA